MLSQDVTGFCPLSPFTSSIGRNGKKLRGIWGMQLKKSPVKTGDCVSHFLVDPGYWIRLNFSAILRIVTAAFSSMRSLYGVASMCAQKSASSRPSMSKSTVR